MTKNYQRFIHYPDHGYPVAVSGMVGSTRISSAKHPRNVSHRSAATPMSCTRGEGVDLYKFGSAADYFGKDTILDADGKGSLQINGQTLEGTFTSFGERGAYRLKLADGSGAGGNWGQGGNGSDTN